MTKKDRSPTSFRLSKEALDLADRMASSLGVSKTAIVEMALREKAERVLSGRRRAKAS